MKYIGRYELHNGDSMRIVFGTKGVTIKYKYYKDIRQIRNRATVHITCKEMLTGFYPANQKEYDFTKDLRKAAMSVGRYDLAKVYIPAKIAVVEYDEHKFVFDLYADPRIKIYTTKIDKFNRRYLVQIYPKKKKLKRQKK